MVEIQLAESRHLSALGEVEKAAASLFPMGRLPEAHLQQTLPRECLQQGVHQGLLWVALKQGSPVGFALLEAWQDIGILAEVDVHPDFSRRGIGGRLVGRCLESAEWRGWQGVGLTTFADLPWNAPFYQRLGFRRVADDAFLPLRQALAQERAAGMYQRVAMFLQFK